MSNLSRPKLAQNATTVLQRRNLKKDPNSKVIETPIEMFQRVPRNIASAEMIQDLKMIPSDIRRVFITAHDIRPEDHIRMQVAFQRHTDNYLTSGEVAEMIVMWWALPGSSSPDRNG